MVFFKGGGLVALIIKSKISDIVVDGAAFWGLGVFCFKLFILQKSVILI